MDAMFGPYIILNRMLILCVLQATQNEWHYWPTKSTAEPMACKIYFSAQWQKTNKKNLFRTGKSKKRNVWVMALQSLTHHLTKNSFSQSRP